MVPLSNLVPDIENFGLFCNIKFLCAGEKQARYTRRKLARVMPEMPGLVEEWPARATRRIPSALMSFPHEFGSFGFLRRNLEDGRPTTRIARTQITFCRPRSYHLVSPQYWHKLVRLLAVHDGCPCLVSNWKVDRSGRACLGSSRAVVVRFRLECRFNVTTSASSRSNCKFAESRNN